MGERELSLWSWMLLKLDRKRVEQRWDWPRIGGEADLSAAATARPPGRALSGLPTSCSARDFLLRPGIYRCSH
jgi:hypothetical protein